MKNIINTTQSFVAESVAGFCLANSTLVTCHNSPLFITRSNIANNKVSIISGGGSGHEPLHLGAIGVGMLDAVCPGELLTSPTPNQILAILSTVDISRGALFIVKNYHGDRMNFKIANDNSDYNIETVLVCDDVFCKRGIAGTIIVEKIVGAAAEKGMSLSELKELALNINANTKTIGFALSSLTLPLLKKPMYDLEEGSIEYGVGIHGEKGFQRIEWLPAKKLARKITDDILSVLSSKNNKKEVLLLINGLGSTPLIELYVMYSEVHTYIESCGYKVVRSLVGNYVTSFNTQGCSVTISTMDDVLLNYWDAPVITSHFNW